MKILSILELARKYGAEAVDKYGRAILDDRGNPVYVLGNPDSASDVLFEKSEKEIIALTAHNVKRQFSYKALLALTDGIDDEEWSEFTYEEIIDMHNNGVVVPDEILQQAYKLLEENELNPTQTEDEELDRVSDGEELSDDTDGFSFADYEKQFANAMYNCETTHDVLQDEMEDIALIEEELIRLQKSSEDKAESTIKDMTDATKEYQTLEEKVAGGNELTDSEKARFEELGKRFGQLNVELQTNTDVDGRNLKDMSSVLSNKMEFANKTKLAAQKAFDVANSLELMEQGTKNISNNAFKNDEQVRITKDNISKILGEGDAFAAAIKTPFGQNVLAAWSVLVYRQNGSSVSGNDATNRFNQKYNDFVAEHKREPKAFYLTRPGDSHVDFKTLMQWGSSNANENIRNMVDVLNMAASETDAFADENITTINNISAIVSAGEQVEVPEEIQPEEENVEVQETDDSKESDNVESEDKVEETEETEETAKAEEAENTQVIDGSEEIAAPEEITEPEVAEEVPTEEAIDSIGAAGEVEEIEEIEEVEEVEEPEEEQPVEGEQPEEPVEEEVVEETLSAIDELKLDGKSAQDLGNVVEAAGNDSEVEGRAALKDVLEIDNKIADLIYGKPAPEVEAAKEEREEVKTEVTDSTQDIEPSAANPNEVNSEEPSDEEQPATLSQTATGMAASISSNIKAVEDEKLSTVERLEKIQDKNNSYAQSINSSMNIMHDIQDKGLDAIKDGVEEIADGTALIAISKMLLSFSIFGLIGLKVADKILQKYDTELAQEEERIRLVELSKRMEAKGSELLEHGTEYAKTGLEVIGIGKDGEEKVESADKQISKTGDILDKAITKAKEDEESQKTDEANETVNGNSDDDKDNDEVQDKAEDGKNTNDDAKKEDNSIPGIISSSKEDAKDSEKSKDDADKTREELEKEANQVKAEMNRDQLEAVKLTKESEKELDEQQQIQAQYEELVTMGETVATVAEEKMANPVDSDNPSTPSIPAVSGVVAPAAVTANPAGAPAGGAADISAEQARIDEISTLIDGLDERFKNSDKVIKTNTKRLRTLDKNIKIRSKKFDKLVTQVDKKIKAEEKAELDKQKKLEQKLAIVGVANNVFTVTMATGSIMMLIPYTAAAGKILFNIGLAGIVACGIAEGTIHLAEGNVEAAMMAFGKAAISAAAGIVGAGSAANAALTAVSSGAQIVSSSASMVNNVRTLQGKEKSEAATMVGDIAGVASALAGAANGVQAAFSNPDATVIDKALSITSAAAALTTSTGQVMNMVDPENESAQTLMMIGGIASSISAAASLANAGVKNLKTKFGDVTAKVDNVDNAQNATPSVDNQPQNNTQQNPNPKNSFAAEDAFLDALASGGNGDPNYYKSDEFKQIQKSAFNEMDSRKNSGISTNIADLKNDKSKTIGEAVDGIGKGVQLAAGFLGNNEQEQMGVLTKKNLQKIELSFEIQQMMEDYKRRIKALDEIRYMQFV